MELEEAIKNIKSIIYDETGKQVNYIDISFPLCEDDIGVKEFIQAIETVLQKLDKLQKHCKEMIKEKQELTSALLDSIPKKKIEDKILQEWQKCPKNSINDFAIVERNNKIQVLQELLEDK